MSHYDDLQRFKDKILTHSQNFKDLSSQSEIYERGDWALINQARGADEEGADPAFVGGGSVSQLVPQPVARDAFAWTPGLNAGRPVESAPAVSLPPAPEKRMPPVSGARLSLIDSVSQSIGHRPPAPAANSPAPAAEPQPSAPAPVTPVAASARTIPRPHPLVAPQPAPAPVIPAARPAASAQAPAGITPYSRLFAAKAPEGDSRHDKEKDQPLKSLLERISTCR